MITAYIMLQANCPWDMLMGLLISLIPALLAWLAARSFYKVAEKDGEIKVLANLRNELDGKVSGLNADLTQVRLALSKAEADAEDKAHRLSNLRNDLIIAESERNLLREKIGPEAADAYLRANISQPVEFEGVFYAVNDYRIFKGIDGDLAAKLHAAGYKTWADLADANPAQLDAVLAGSGLSAADLIRQAKLVLDKDWNGLKAFQHGLILMPAARNTASIEFAGRRWQKDDLEIVEGIGPKIAALLHNAGIHTWDDLCKSSPERLREILDAAGPDYAMHDPSTWPDQACLAAAGDWGALQTLQDQLIGGRNAGSVSRHPEFIDFAGKTFKWDDLKIVEGIGPKIEELFHDAGIKTWHQLSETAPERLKEILDAAGPNYAMHDPGSWPQQAGLAHERRWDDLQRLQDELTAGR